MVSVVSLVTRKLPCLKAWSLIQILMKDNTLMALELNILVTNCQLAISIVIASMENGLEVFPNVVSLINYNWNLNKPNFYFYFSSFTSSRLAIGNFGRHC